MTLTLIRSIEKKIVRQFISELVEQGFFLYVADPDSDDQPEPSQDKAKLLEDALACDESRIVAIRGRFADDSFARSWGFFVFGNTGWDVLCDYGVNLEAYIPKTLALSDKMSQLF